MCVSLVQKTRNGEYQYFVIHQWQFSLGFFLTVESVVNTQEKLGEREEGHDNNGP